MILVLNGSWDVQPCGEKSSDSLAMQNAADKKELKAIAGVDRCSLEGNCQILEKRFEHGMEKCSRDDDRIDVHTQSRQASMETEA